MHDNVAYALQVTGGSRREVREKVPDILRLTGLSTKLHNYPDQLSGGEQQRVSVARAFVNHPPLLLADEPTGNLDPETSVGIMQLLYRINRTGTTVARRDARQVDGRPHAPARDRGLAGPRSCATSGPAATAARADDARVRRALARGARVRFGFFFREALRALRRNAVPSFAAVATVLVTVLVLGVFIPVVQATTGAANEIRAKVLVDVYLKSDATRRRHRRACADRSSARRPGVGRVEFISKEDAIKAEREAGRGDFYDLLGSNPLPDLCASRPSDAGGHRRRSATRSRRCRRPASAP